MYFFLTFSYVFFDDVVKKTQRTFAFFDHQNPFFMNVEDTKSLTMNNKI
jgi:hypothetical protein